MGGDVTSPATSLIHRDKNNDDLWTITYTRDELIFQLSSSNEYAIDKTKQIHITHKYIDRAEFVLYRINIWDPSKPPIFIINCSDITLTLQKELEQLKKTDPQLFDRVVTDAIQSLMEGINERYYHISSVAYKISWRFDP